MPALRTDAFGPYNAGMAQRIALVTGASSGIGAAIARRLAADGWGVFAAGRDPARTNALAGAAIRLWVGALADSADAVRLVAACVLAFGGLDLLVNNAGIYEVADAEATTDDAWQRTIAINLSMPFYLSRAALPEPPSRTCSARSRSRRPPRPGRRCCSSSDWPNR